MHERFPYLTHHVEVPILGNVSRATVVYCFLAIGSSIYYFMSHWNFKLFIKNGFLHMLVVYSSLSLVNSLGVLDVHKEILEFREKLITCAGADAETSSKIERNIRFWRYLRIAAALICQIVAFTCVPVSGDFREIYNLLYLFDNWEQYTKFAATLRFLTIFAKMFLAHIIYIPNFACNVVFGDMIYGIMIIRKKLQLMDADYSLRNTRTKKEDYQKKVELTLKMCARQHSTVLEYASLTRKHMKLSIFGAYNIGVIFAALFYFCVTMENSFKAIIKASLIIVVLIFFIYTFCYLGQTLANECDLLHLQLVNCHWVHWNIQNKKLYLIILINCREPIIFRSMALEVSYTLLSRFLKDTISILTVINKITSE
ncbi:uncharacterized protein LOC123313732 [Coccinella septempunctata]|uniref:uncharacterized protein LOC123313732 n=1 Tax=Coccinella septempunctata TaxID=41139 RepID=UPI001D08349E|nr:uncharacterized protein LOC123313732 [Coccinella septempunctata]